MDNSKLNNQTAGEVRNERDALAEQLRRLLSKYDELRHSHGEKELMIQKLRLQLDSALEDNVKLYQENKQLRGKEAA